MTATDALLTHPDGIAVGTQGRRRPTASTVAAATFVGLVLVCAAIGHWIAPHSPSRQNPQASDAGPSSAHLLGTDQLGRDVLSRLIVGAWPAIAGPTCVAIACLLVGGVLGTAAGFRGRWTDTVVGRFADIIYALPALLIAIVVVGVLGGGYWLTVAILTVLSLPYEIRICRSVTDVQSRLPYVDAARGLGLSDAAIIGRHILPNIVPTLVATFLLDFTGAIVGFASLEFLGLGVAPGTADWGTMLSDGQSLITLNPWLCIGPAVLLILTALSVTVLGDWIYRGSSLGTDR